MAVVPKVVVVGAGFGGIEVARGLKGAPVEVTLVDQHNFHTFQPLLYQVATAGLSPTDVAHVVRGLFHRQTNVRFRQGRVTGVDWAARTVAIDGQPDLPFDHLVLAAGATVTWFGTPGAAEHGFPLYTLDDAARLRNHVLRALRGGRSRPGASSIAGGSPSWSSAVGPPASRPPARWPSCSPWCSARTTRASTCSRARVVLVEMQDHLLHPFTASSRRHALETLRVARRRGATRRPGRVRLLRRRDVRRRRGAAVPDAGLGGRRAGEPAGGRARPPAGPRRPGHRRARPARARAVRARGRSATSPPPPIGDGEVLPQLAPVAMQSGRHVARQIRRLLEGRPTTPFRYLDKGIMATIGRRAAVAELPGRIHLRGGLAWLAWLGLHLVTLVGPRNRASVLLNWAWNYLTWDRGPRLITGTVPPHDR